MQIVALNIFSGVPDRKSGRGGKISAYLSSHNPKLYTHLLGKGVISPVECEEDPT